MFNIHSVHVGSSSLGYTPEQEEGAKKILKASKKSHYEVRTNIFVLFYFFFVVIVLLPYCD